MSQRYVLGGAIEISSEVRSIWSEVFYVHSLKAHVYACGMLLC